MNRKSVLLGVLLIVIVLATASCSPLAPSAEEIAAAMPTAAPPPSADEIAQAIVAVLPEQASAEEIGKAVAAALAQPTPTATAEETATPEATPGTGLAMAPGTEVIAPVLPDPYLSEGGVPYSEDSITFDLRKDEVEIYTCGPVTAAGVSLPGGEKRASVVIMLPSSANQVVRYTLTGVLPGSGWHGAYQFTSYPTEAEWRGLAENASLDLTKAPNCSDGLGCEVVDILVVKPGPVVVAQWTVGKTTPPSPAVAALAPAPGSEVAMAPAAPVAEAAGETEHSLTSGEEWTVPTGWLVSGDVEYFDPGSGNWIVVYDGSIRGNILVANQAVKIKAPWGAWATSTMSLEELESTMRASGCGVKGGCPTVEITYWPKK